jgi:sulfur dioxygenase
MLFKELNLGKCKTYLIACDKHNEAVLIDPVQENIERYLAVLAYHGLKLIYVIDTHTHADHRSACKVLSELTDAKIVMHRLAPHPLVDVHVEEGDELKVGNIVMQVLYTPGHTPDGIALVLNDRVLTGDTLMIKGTGRTDFAGGNPAEEYDSIIEKLFTLPDETLVFPAHDYRGNTQSTIGEEKNMNPRVAGKNREQFIDIMENLGLPLPDNIQEVLQLNQTELDDDLYELPSIAELSKIRQYEPGEVKQALEQSSPPILIDVRTEGEFNGTLGHIESSMLIPLDKLSDNIPTLEQYKKENIIVVCRSGVRSTTAAALLTGMGFEKVSNLRGGMLAWNEAAKQ